VEQAVAVAVIGVGRDQVEPAAGRDEGHRGDHRADEAEFRVLNLQPQDVPPLEVRQL
jgi:hypothetical protein